VRLELPAVVHDRFDPLLLESAHFQRYQPVVEQNPGTDPDIARQIVVGGRELAGLGDCFRSEDDLLPGLQADRLRQVPDANPRPLQIQQDCGCLSPALEKGAELMNPAGSGLGGAVRCGRR
jgi:hypothetical protein